MSLSKILQTVLGAAVVAGIGIGGAVADEYPSKPITLIIPLGAGGSHDMNARAFTSVIPTYLGQPVVVKLMPGAGGQKGTAAAVKARPDGYTLIFTHNYVDQLQQHVEKLPYDTTKDLTTIARLNFAPASVVVRADKPWNTLEEMFDYGRKNPGKLVYGHSGNWGAIMVPGARLLAEAKVQANFVPYKGGGPAMKALLSGDSDFTMAFPSVVLSQGSNLKVLASAGQERRYKDVPTFKELGYAANIGSMQRIVMAPSGIAPDRKAKLYAAFQKLPKDKTFKRLMKSLGENMELMGPDEYEKERAKQKIQYKKLVEDMVK